MNSRHESTDQNRQRGPDEVVAPTRDDVTRQPPDPARRSDPSEFLSAEPDVHYPERPGPDARRRYRVLTWVGAGICVPCIILFLAITTGLMTVPLNEAITVILVIGIPLGGVLWLLGVSKGHDRPPRHGDEVKSMHPQ